MRWTRGGFFVVFAFLAMPFLAITVLATSDVATAALKAAPRVSHKLVQEIKISDKSGSTLQSMTRTADGRIVALLGPSQQGGFSLGSLFKTPKAAIQVFEKDGAQVKSWPVKIPGQAIGAGPDGAIYVGGNGKI